jgi:uncharacterized protein (DUF2344 family)
MKIKLIFILFIALCSCNTQNYTPATSAIEAASVFVDACKLGEFKKANFYMLQDAANEKLLHDTQKKYHQYNLEEKRQLADASLQNITIENITTTEVIIYYNNSTDKERRKVKAVFKDNQWLVDFKFSFNPNL